MTTERGTAKQNLRRAITAARHIQQRVGDLPEVYPEFPEFEAGCRLAATSAVALEDLISKLLERVP